MVEKKPLRLGMITVEPHGRPWAEVLARMPQAKMACAWDYDMATAQSYAETYHIPLVVQEPEEMLGHVDAVLIGGGRRGPEPGEVWGQKRDDHLRLARPFLERGLPVLVDKPCADTLEDAIEMVRLARTNHALLLSSSAMRFDTQIIALKEVIDDGGVGKVLGAVAVLGTGKTTLKWYLIHMLEALHTALGPGIDSVVTLPSHAPLVLQGTALPSTYGVVFRWQDGRVATVLMACDDKDTDIHAGEPDPSPRILWPTDYNVPPYLGLHYNVRVYGLMNWADCKPVGKGCYTHKLAAFFKMIETGQEVVPLEQTLEVTQALILAEKSAALGQVETLRPVESLLRAVM
jgi:hypothetical protein